jgi:hypothetical protein
MVRLANARAQVSAAAAAAIQLATPLITVVANEVSFWDTAVFLVGGIAKHFAAVKGVSFFTYYTYENASVFFQSFSRIPFSRLPSGPDHR